MNKLQKLSLVIFVLFGVINLSLADNATLLSEKHESLTPSNKSSYKYIIISLDGGGVRGIVPARILQEIEKKTNKSIWQLTDMIAGNSTGGIIALALVTPDGIGKAKYAAKDLVTLYRDRSAEIFSQSIWKKIASGAGLWGAKYDRTNLDNILKEKFGDALLSDTLKPALVLSYSLDKADVHFWTTRIARTSSDKDFYLRDIAGATSAAPTYFAPKVLKNKNGKVCRSEDTTQEDLCYEADGGLFANNPAVVAITESYRAIHNLEREDILLISIGTGQVKLSAPINNLKNSGVLGWVWNANLIDVIMSASSLLTEWEAEILDIKSFRIQIDLPTDLGQMDNTNTKHIQALLDITEQYIADNRDLIDEVCKKLLTKASK